MARVVFLLAALAVLAALLAGCGGAAPGAGLEKDAEGRYVIHMTASDEFIPAKLTIPAGATVVWVNDARDTHDVAVTDTNTGREVYYSEDDPPVGMGAPVTKAGESFAYTFGQAGVFATICHYHHAERMQGLITVK